MKNTKRYKKSGQGKFSSQSSVMSTVDVIWKEKNRKWNILDCYAEQKYYTLKFFAVDSTCTHLFFF